LGTDELGVYLEKYDLELDEQYQSVIGRHAKKPWNKFITPENSHLVSEEVMDLIENVLRYDHEERLTAAEAQAHPFFNSVRGIINSNSSSSSSK
jgi:casein kinase II subunit alpha